ncbi:hypothetical protein N9498_01035 [Porticoccaceae bacterium]|nr:hypothetical protein [Porticoccaceae bacterium]
MSSIIVVVSVDWEGSSLFAENIKSIRTFRERHPYVPIQQFLNAAYYSQMEEADEIITDKINSVLLPSDGHGLHLHAWMSLQQRAGVDIRNSPLFCDETLLAEDGISDVGYAVPMESFSVDELSLMIKDSVGLLTDQGFKRPTCFRAGGWQAGSNVFEALTANDFKLDASGANTQIVTKVANASLGQKLLKLWPMITDESQPYVMNTANGELWELPNNGSLADFITAEEMLVIFNNNVDRWKVSPDKPVFFSIGFHQETASLFLDRISQVVTEIQEIADRENIPIIFTAEPLKYMTGFNS